MLTVTVGVDSNLVFMMDIKNADVQTLRKIQIVMTMMHIVVVPNSTPSMFQDKDPQKFLILVSSSSFSS